MNISQVGTVSDHANEVRVPALDGLRGIALITVVLAHTTPQIYPGGNIGVDLFFVLSGFLITSLLLREHERSGRIRIWHFYARRGLRLLPALAVLVLAVLVYSWVFEPETFSSTLMNAAAVMTYWWNWWSAFEIGPQQAMFRHLWSLSVEEQFYIAWPVVLTLALPRPRLFAALLAVGMIGPAIGRMLLWESGPSLHLYFRTDLRFDNLMWGAATAWLLFQRKVPSFVPVLGVVAFVAYFVMARFDLLSGGFLYLGGYSLVGLIGASMIAAAVAGEPSWLRAALEFRPLRWTGKISYGLYLWHVPVFHLCRDLPMDALSRNLVAIFATFLVATISYYGMERHFLSLKERLGKPTIRHHPLKMIQV